MRFDKRFKNVGGHVLKRSAKVDSIIDAPAHAYTRHIERTGKQQ